MTRRLSLISLRQQAASFGTAAMMTLAVLAALGQLADGYVKPAAEAGADVAVQQVVIVAKRAA